MVKEWTKAFKLVRGRGAFLTEVQDPLHAGVVDDNVEFGEALGDRDGSGGDALGVGGVEGDGLDARVGAGGVAKNVFAAAGDDDGIAELVKGFGETSADAGAAAGDEDGVASGLHGAMDVTGVRGDSF